VPAGHSATLLQEEASAAEPSVTFTWIAPLPAVLTGGASAIAATTATVNGTVNPDNSLVTACQFAITPAPPAGATIPCAQQVGAGGTPVAVSANLAGLSPSTTYTVTLTGASVQGSASGSPVSFTTSSPTSSPTSTPTSGGASAGVVLAVTDLKLSPIRFELGKGAATIAKRKTKPLPTSATISFTLSQAATVTLSFERVLTGVLVGHKCTRPTRSGRKARKCVRHSTVPGGVTLNAQAGAEQIHFDGVLDGDTSLTPGNYELSLSATDSTGKATASQHPTFTLLG